MRRRPKPPADLSEASKVRWPGLAADLTAVTEGALIDFDLLAEVLRAEDGLAQVRAALDSAGLLVAGSKGQLRPHPLLITESVLRREVGHGYERLGLAPRGRGSGINVGDDGRLRSPYG